MTPRVFFIVLMLLVLAAYVAVGQSLIGVDRPAGLEQPPDTAAWTGQLGAALVRRRPVTAMDLQLVLGTCDDRDRQRLQMGQGQSCSVLFKPLAWRSAVTRELRLQSAQAFQAQAVFTGPDGAVQRGQAMAAKNENGHLEVLVDVFRDGGQVLVTCLQTNCLITLLSP
ncbi:hypothetical protein QR90_08405 [Deinococcus radiopugnans]|uniref:Uncharacterized protein n=1 Tax=Deinococcus radiopugnans TaxID=57497 RepID=A0A0A7KG47_9DEIO|nr:hypothetical protein [Deinococcus radiopugnans]AIZ45121.1 hypothetical protein QR90_08405 [Deinococcus radiopugnans]